MHGCRYRALNRHRSARLGPGLLLRASTARGRSPIAGDQGRTSPRIEGAYSGTLRASCVVFERAIPSGQAAALERRACNCCPVAIGTLRMPYATVTTNEEGHRSVPLRSMCMTRRVRDATPS